jgi:hypothetical protein
MCREDDEVEVVGDRPEDYNSGGKPADYISYLRCAWHLLHCLASSGLETESVGVDIGRDASSGL